MSILKRATVLGLWGDKTATLDLNPTVNFLIGVNGSGKTSFLNLIASALSSDYDGLAKLEFSTVECFLFSPKESTEFKLTVRRSQEEGMRASYIYLIEEEGKPERRFELINPVRFGMPASMRHRYSSDTYVVDGALSPLNNLIKVQWLSVYRSPLKGRASEERNAPESSVDRRLTTLSNQLVRYFSKLAAAREHETNRFLRQMLGALVYNASEFDPFSKIDLPEVKKSIQILMDTFLSGGSKRTRERLNKHFELAEKAREDKNRFELDELVALAAVLPMKKIVEEWNATQIRQEALAKPRTEFLEIMNSMFKNKKLLLNDKNELEVELSAGKHLSLSELSSGEKQLLILFSEALLQEKAEFIYIADEPELSLHVSWQEQLTRNLMKINPEAQMIFATHSPDIVSEFGQYAFDMEALFV